MGKQKVDLDVPRNVRIRFKPMATLWQLQSDIYMALERPKYQRSGTVLCSIPHVQVGILLPVSFFSKVRIHRLYLRRTLPKVRISQIWLPLI